MAETPAWQTLASQKRDELLAAIPPQWRLPHPVPAPHEQRDVTGAYIQQFLSAREVEITETDAVGILQRTTTGKWKAREVVEAFCHRAALAHQMVPCLHEILFARALTAADALDAHFAAHSAHFAAHSAPIGPLHGLPVSLKDSFNLAGTDTTTGLLALVGSGAHIHASAAMAQTLAQLGAVTHVKTAVPQASFALQTTNNIVGFVRNPANRVLSGGGSSGGEGVLLALRGSAAGIGTDIGGSVRVPAAFNALFGLKPSFCRLPLEGVARVMEGQDMVPFAVGPLATTARGLRVVMEAVLGGRPWEMDPRVVEIPWREDEFETARSGTAGGRLCFAVMRTDGSCDPVPPVARAMDLTVKTLERLGHKIVGWNPPSHEEALKLAFDTYFFEGGQEIHDLLSATGEPHTAQITELFGAEPREPYTARAIADTNVAIWQYRKRYMDYWNSTAALTGTGRPVDAVIAPVSAHAVPEEDKLRYFGYTPYLNVLDYTVGVIPVTHADKSVDVYPEDPWIPLNDIDKLVRDEYNPETIHGAPVGISIIGRRYQDEKVLGIMEVLGAEVAKAESKAAEKL